MTTTVTQTHTTTTDRKFVIAQLAAAGIKPSVIVRNRETGAFIVDYFIPDMTKGVNSAKWYAQKIKRAIPQATILTTHDSVAWHREGAPNLNALVIFEVCHA